MNKKLLICGLPVWLVLSLFGVAHAAKELPSEPKTEAKDTKETESKDPDELGAVSAGDYLSGVFARANGDVDAAIPYLRRVYASQPDNINIASQLESALLLRGDIAEAMDIADDILDINPKDPIAALLITLKSIKSRDLERANATMDAVSSAGTGQLWVPLISGWIDAEQHMLKKPLTIEGLTATVGQATTVANYHLALINSFAGFTDAATDNFLAAASDPARLSQRVMQAMVMFYDANNQPEKLKKIVEAYRQIAQNDQPELMPSFKNIDDGVSEILFTMGSIMLGAGGTQDAALYLQLTLYMKPTMYSAALALGDTYSTMKQYERSNKAYARIPAASILYNRAQLNMAVNLDRMYKTKEAIDALAKLSKHAPRDIDVLVARADLMRIHNRYKEAVEIYSKAEKLIDSPQPFHWPLYFARGACYERIGKWDKAEADLRKALELKPNQPEVLNYLGYGWAERGENLDEAQAMILNAVKQRPNDPQMVDSMGWVLYLKGDFTQAAAFLEKAVELLPSDPTTNDHLGDAYWRMGRKNEARFQWERSLTYSPEPELATSLHRKIKEGLPPAAEAKAAAGVISDASH